MSRLAFCREPSLAVADALGELALVLLAILESLSASSGLDACLHLSVVLIALRSLKLALTVGVAFLGLTLVLVFVPELDLASAVGWLALGEFALEDVAFLFAFAPVHDTFSLLLSIDKHALVHVSSFLSDNDSKSVWKILPVQLAEVLVTALKIHHVLAGLVRRLGSSLRRLVESVGREGSPGSWICQGLHLLVGLVVGLLLSWFLGCLFLFLFSGFALFAALLRLLRLLHIDLLLFLTFSATHIKLIILR